MPLKLSGWFLAFSLAMCAAGIWSAGVALSSPAHAHPSAARAQASTSPAPSIYVEQLGPDGAVTQRRDVARLVFTDGTVLDCAALFVTPPSRPLGSGVRTISFEVPGGLRIVFDHLQQP
jgi:hypothetical protein